MFVVRHIALEGLRVLSSCCGNATVPSLKVNYIWVATLTATVHQRGQARGVIAAATPVQGGWCREACERTLLRPLPSARPIARSLALFDTALQLGDRIVPTKGESN